MGFIRHRGTENEPYNNIAKKQQVNDGRKQVQATGPGQRHDPGRDKRPHDRPVIILHQQAAGDNDNFMGFSGVVGMRDLIGIDRERNGAQ
mgnify:CR=1 FL=1